MWRSGLIGSIGQAAKLHLHSALAHHAHCRLAPPGIVGVVNSLLHNTAERQRMYIHLLVPDGADKAFRGFLECHDLELGPRLQVALDNSHLARAAHPHPHARAPAPHPASHAAQVMTFGERAPEVRVKVKATNLERRGTRLDPAQRRSAP